MEDRNKFEATVAVFIFSDGVKNRPRVNKSQLITLVYFCHIAGGKKFDCFGCVLIRNTGLRLKTLTLNSL